MVARTKARTAGFIVNKTSDSKLFQTYLGVIGANHAHFATTLNQNPQTFMPIYNDHVMDNTSVTIEQEALGLTNQVKLGICTLFLLAAADYDEPGLASYELADEFINYQLPIMEQGGLRFIEEEKTSLMAAVWYNWVTSGRHGTMVYDICEAFYDTFWVFLKPTDQARAVEFNRTAFAKEMEKFVTARTKKAEPPAIKMATVKTFGQDVQNAQRLWFHAQAQNPQPMDEETFNNFLATAVNRYKEVSTQKAKTKWLNKSKEKINWTDSRFFENSEALIRCFSGAMLLDRFDTYHSKYLTLQLMNDLAHQATSEFFSAGYTVSIDTAGTANEMAEISVFNFWTAINTYASHVCVEPTTTGELHLRIGAEMALIAENLVYTLVNFFETTDPGNVSKQVLVNSIVTKILGFLTEACHPHVSSNVNPPVNSIFVIGAEVFYNNLSSIITKEIEMTKATKTRAANQILEDQARAAAAESVIPEQALEALMGELEGKFKATVMEATSVMTKELEKTFKKDINDLAKRLEHVETVMSQTVDTTKLNETGKENLKKINKAAKDAVNSSKKKYKRGVTGVHELTTMETCAVVAGGVLVGGAIGYGIYRLADWMLNDE